MSGYVGNKRSVSFVSAELPIRKGLESIVEEDGSYRLLDGASLKKSDGSTIIHSDGTIEGVDLSPIQNQIDSIEADITSLNSSVDLVEASVNQIPPRLESFRNKIINGDMRIAQRGTSFSTNNGRNFGVDRFACNASTNTTITFSQSTDAPSGFTNSLLATVTSANSSRTAGDTNYILQGIEGYNIADLNFGTLSAKNFTFSFYVKSSLTGSFGVGFSSNNNDRVYHTNYTINSANTWEHKTIQVSGPTSGTWLTNNGLGLMVIWDLGLGTNFESNTTNVWDSNNDYRRSTDVNLSLNAGATFYITGVQLEEGPIATPFEHRPLSVELAMCQRYFQKSYNLNIPIGTPTGTGNSGYVEWNWGAMSAWGTVQIPFRQSMRVSPTFSIYNIGSGVLNGFAYWDGSQTVQTTYSVGSFQFGENWAIWFLDGTVRSNVQFHWSADAEL